LKAQVAAKNANLNISGSSGLPPRPASPAADPVNPNIAKKGGLSAMPMHPSLMDHTTSAPGEGVASAGSSATQGKGRFSRVMAPKFTSVAANARLASASPSTSKRGSPMPTRPTLIAPSSNPYLSATSVDPDLPPDVQAAQSEMEALATRRRKATLHFNAKGKYIQQAEEIRKEAKFEELKQRIAEQSRKAGLDSEFDVLERNIKRQPPPEIEWWDAPLLKNASYNDLDMGDEGTLVRSDDSLVTIYVQHPVPLPAPFESKEEQPRGLMLTKKVNHDVHGDMGPGDLTYAHLSIQLQEQKKMRRQRRAAELKDKQDRQRLGLLPMDPPKG
jgi:U4/U6 small nuclear ribonucleoprotein PRP3